MAVDFYYIFRYLEGASFFTIVVPFLLVFIILFALLQKTQVLGEKTDPSVSIFVSILLAALAISSTRLVEFMNAYLGNIALVVVIFAVTMLLIQFAFGIKSPAKWFTVILAVIAIIWVFTQASYLGGTYGGTAYIFSDILFFVNYYMGPILLIGALALVVWVVVRISKTSGGSNNHDK